MELMRDKFVLWSRSARQGPMDMRDYNARCAEALKVLIAEHSETHDLLADGPKGHGTAPQSNGPTNEG